MRHSFKSQDRERVVLVEKNHKDKSYTKDQGKVIDRSGIVQRLKNSISEMSSLIEKLQNTEGTRRPFTANEKELVRTTYFAVIKECTAELQHFYLLGDVEAFEMTQEALHGWMKEISDL
jgi:hypothetical protein